MNLRNTVALIMAGGPGSGCKGPNCGRKAGAKYQMIETPLRPAYDVEGEKARVDYVSPSGKQSTIGEWLDRQGFEQDETGHYVMYHATPKNQVFDRLRPGSHMIDNPEQAAFFAGRDRGLKPNQIKVFKVRVRPSEVDGGIWPISRTEIPLV